MSIAEKSGALTLQQVVVKRETKIAAAAPVLSEELFAVNRLAKERHPDAIRVRVSERTELGGGAVSFHFAPVECTALPMFRAGQFINLSFPIGSSFVTRVYSLCSSPLAGRRGDYQIAVKRDVFASAYLQDTLKVGDELTISAPSGEFGFHPLRDAKHVIGVAGGSGITPFLSMARAIDEDSEDFSLTLLYGARTREDALFADELRELAERCSRFRVVFVLSEEEAEGYEHGFITGELIRKQMLPGENANSIFMAGPEAMYSFLDKELESLHLRRKFIRKVLPGSVRDPYQFPDWPAGNEERSFTIAVKLRDQSYSVPASGGEPVLVALERAGVPTQAHCRSGSCGFCRAKLVSGSVFVPDSREGRRAADLIYGYIHPCSTWPCSDLSVEL